MTLPPDRGHVGTEQRHPESLGFDELATTDAVRLMADDARRVREAVDAAAPAIAAFIDALVERMARGGRLVYAGAGTSGRLGVLDASECPPTFHSDPSQVIGIIAGGDSALRRSSEGKEDDPNGIAPDLERIGFGAADTLLAIAAGGTTPYARGAVRLAKARGGLTAFLAHARCEAPEGCDHMLLVETGPELLTGSTRLKAGSATKLVLNSITTIAFARLGKVHGNLMVDLAASNEKLRDRAIRLLSTLHPELSRAQAAATLERAGWSLKVAAVMHARGISAEEAGQRLDAAGGNLRRALDRR